LVKAEPEEVLRLRLDRTTPESLDQFIEEIEVADDAEEKVLGEPAVRRGKALAAGEVIEKVGGVAGGVLPFGEGVEGAAARGGDGHGVE
jgi:hypothetical protein